MRRAKLSSCPLIHFSNSSEERWLSIRANTHLLYSSVSRISSICVSVNPLSSAILLLLERPSHQYRSDRCRCEIRCIRANFFFSRHQYPPKFPSAPVPIRLGLTVCLGLLSGASASRNITPITYTLDFPVPSPLLTYHGGRVAETEWVRFVVVPPKTGLRSVSQKRKNYKSSLLLLPPRRFTPTARSQIPFLRFRQCDRNLTSAQ